MPSLSWRDGATPVSDQFDDPYFSIRNGLEETCHVFLAGNDLPRRFRPGFHIAELGFGTGLNALASLALWRTSGQAGILHFSSFEAYPLSADETAKALEAWPQLGPDVDWLVAALRQGQTEIDAPGFHLSLIIGDANETLPDWKGRADAWFLDGFSPAKNPELWKAGLMAEVAAHTAPSGTFATYSAAGHVRQALDRAGFDVERMPGYGTKRHMSRGVLR